MKVIIVFLTVINHFVAKKTVCQVRIKLLETYSTLIPNYQKKKKDYLLIPISKCCQNQPLQRFEYPLIKNIYQKQPGTGSYPKDI